MGINERLRAEIDARTIDLSRHKLHGRMPSRGEMEAITARLHAGCDVTVDAGLVMALIDGTVYRGFQTVTDWDALKRLLERDELPPFGADVPPNLPDFWTGRVIEVVGAAVRCAHTLWESDGSNRRFHIWWDATVVFPLPDRAVRSTPYPKRRFTASDNDFRRNRRRKRQS